MEAAVNKHEHGAEGHGGHGHMVADFRRRFWVSLLLTLPVLALAPLIQRFLGIAGVLSFPGDSYVQALFATAIYFYGGWPFLKVAPTFQSGSSRDRCAGFMAEWGVGTCGSWQPGWIH